MNLVFESEAYLFKNRPLFMKSVSYLALVTFVTLVPRVTLTDTRHLSTVVTKRALRVTSTRFTAAQAEERTVRTILTLAIFHNLRVGGLSLLSLCIEKQEIK